MELISQLSLLEADNLAKETKLTSYFADLLQFFSMEDDFAGWVDSFADALHMHISNILEAPIRTLSLFSGGGGLDIAFHDSGFLAVQMIEMNPRYVETLKSNIQVGMKFENSEPLCMDIRDFQPLDSLNVDFIIGGPPCQTFSAAGRRAAGVSGIDDPRGLLFREYVRVLKLLQPKGFLFENVYGIIGAQGGKAWQEILDTFASVGYTISYRILDAADYGVPQHRERLIIVGTRGKRFVFPKPTHGPDSADKRAYHTAGLAIENVHDEKPGPVNGRYGHLLKDIPPGLNYSFYTEKMGHPHPHFAWRSKFSDLLYKADPAMPVRTIKALGGQYTGPFHWENRPFSINELKRLQTFPDNYTLIGGRLLAIEQIGNSVPPQFGRMLALAVLEQIFGVKLPFRIDYLAPDEELSFRQRKSNLTQYYQEKARLAIANMTENPHINSVPMTLEDINVFDEKEEIEETAICRAYLGTDFSWHVMGDSVQVYPWNFEYSVIKRENSLEFRVGNAQNISQSPMSVIEVTPTKKWNLPVQTIQLVSYDTSLLSLTACWKVFEHYIVSKKFKADLVQLNNYYQYAPLIIIKVQFSPVVHENESMYQWEILKKILEGKGVRQITAIENVANLWGLTIKKTIDFLILLRSLGYEVRSEYTNNQIPSGCILIPYSFPTFTPKSVQLRKTLFPTVFGEQQSTVQSAYRSIKGSYR